MVALRLGSRKARRWNGLWSGGLEGSVGAVQKRDGMDEKNL